MGRVLIVLLLTATPLAMGLRMNKARSLRQLPNGQRHLSVDTADHWHATGAQHSEADGQWSERARAKAMQARERAGRTATVEQATVEEGFAAADPDKETQEWKDFIKYKLKFKKNYATLEESKLRFAIFKEKQLEIAEHKNKVGMPWEASMNKFSDWTPEEKDKILGRKKGKAGVHFTRSPEDTLDHTHKLDLEQVVPEEMNWSIEYEDGDSGIHFSGSYIRDQGQCGSCWAVATTEVLEAHLELAKESRAKLTELGRYNDFTGVALSTESLVDCVINTNQCGGTGGCDGATEDIAFKFVKEHGMPWGVDYQYTAGMGSSGKCDWDKENAAMVHIENWVNLPVNGDANAAAFSSATKPSALPLIQSLVQVGPTTVGVGANGWFMYGSGIYKPRENDPKEWDINHAVAAFGFGKDKDSGLHYWLIKNSWGPHWGENGFIRLERAAKADEEACGIDETPLDGSACLLPVPDKAPRKVCGSNGILSEVAYPCGVHIK